LLPAFALMCDKTIVLVPEIYRPISDEPTKSFSIKTNCMPRAVV